MISDALEKEDMWLTKAIELLEHRPDYQVLRRLPRIGTPTAAAILTGIEDITKYRNGKQLVKLAGLDLKVFESGTTMRKRPKISHVGSAYLRHWLYHYAKRLVAHDLHFKDCHQRRKERSPGKGAGQRALVAVSDKIIRIVYRVLADNERYNPKRDQVVPADT